MKPVVWMCLGLWLLAVAAIPAWGRRDPLNSDELDQLREVAQQPDKRLPLYVKLIQARMDALGQLHSDPRFSTDHDARIHDLLEDVDTLVGELDDNIDVYVRQYMDIRKPLQKVIEMDSDLQQRLTAMKQRSKAEELRTFGFALDSAIESVEACLDNARQVIQEQEKEIKGKRK
jgi:hypothetical protein